MGPYSNIASLRNVYNKIGRLERIPYGMSYGTLVNGTQMRI